MSVKNLDSWQGADTVPTRKGWYRVRRVDDGSIAFRPWANDQWWTPRPDGWSARVNAFGLYEWQPEPICDVEDGASPLSPIEEMDRVQQRWERLPV